MINVSNFTSEDKPPQERAPARAAAAPDTWTSPAPRRDRLLARLGAGLAALARRSGDRLFAMGDAEASWHGWQTTRTHRGLGRRYRDPLFDTLAQPTRGTTTPAMDLVS